MLNGFQTDLSSISSEIQTLQQQSVAMNQRLKNRQAVRGELSQFVDEMVVPDTMITSVTHSTSLSLCLLAAGMDRAFGCVCLSLCVSVCLCSKTKTAWAINTKVGRDVVDGRS